MLINLTPHPIVIFKENAPDLIDESDYTGWVLTVIPTSGYVARLEEMITGSDRLVFLKFEVQIKHVEFGHLTYDPPQKPNVFYIVSLATALAVKRNDFLIPYKEVRNLGRTVIGCRALASSC